MKEVVMKSAKTTTFATIPLRLGRVSFQPYQPPHDDSLRSNQNSHSYYSVLPADLLRRFFEATRTSNSSQTRCNGGVVLHILALAAGTPPRPRL